MPPPPLAPSTASTEDRTRRRVAIGAGAVAVVLFAGVAAFALFGIGSGPDHPDDWDPRVTDLVAFVESERGLDFEHPVHIDFLTPAEYSEATRSSEADLTDDERESLEESSAMFRSLGLLSGEVDLFDAINDLSDTGTLAFYDPATQRITVRGTEMTIDVEVTLVHELTHALQDQHFDLDRLNGFDTSGESAAFRAVVEGDASLVETHYVEQLPEAAQDEYEQTYLEQLESTPIDDIPGILMASFGASYALGEPLVGIVQEDGGWDAVDDMLREPPTTELELFDAVAFLDGFEPVDVDPVEPATDHDVLEEGDFGAIILYLMLASRLDPLDALAATDTWTGDAYLTSRDPDGRICTEVVTASSDADLLEDAMTEWVDGAPSEADAEVDRSDDRVTLRACDPGREVDVEMATDPLDAIAIPATRSFLVYGVILNGLEAQVGSCVADEVLTEIPIEVLTDPDPDDAVIAELQSTMFTSMQACARGDA